MSTLNNAAVTARCFARVAASAACAWLVMLNADPAAAGSSAKNVRRQLVLRLHAVEEAARLAGSSEALAQREVVERFYAATGHSPVWVTDDAVLPRTADLIGALRAAGDEGFDPRDYHLTRIAQLAAWIDLLAVSEERPDPAGVAELELLATDAYLLYARHALSGRIDPRAADPEWRVVGNVGDPVAHLRATVADPRLSPSRRLASLLPKHPHYARLRRALASYRAQAGRGGWGRVSSGPALRRGMVGGRVVELRRRLAHEPEAGLLRPAAELERLDAWLEFELQAFQRRHGLEPDGIIGPATLAELNVPIEYRIDQIVLNMERWRWLARDFGRHHILVNIPAAELEVFDDGQLQLAMRVVVGRPDRPTPVFSSRMTHLILNPSWNVPETIAVEDLLPKIKADPTYLEREGIAVIQGWGEGQRVLDPAEISWAELSPRRFPFRLRQAPGPRNALGAVKFMFPNDHSVYLHATPNVGLFSRSERTASSGCIRLQRPLDLAGYLVQLSHGWDLATLEAEIAQESTRTLSFREPIPVHLLYWTTWSDAEGFVHFRPDVYDKDRRLVRALHARTGPGGAG